MNFVDIHSHILPGLDDGPDTVEQSIAMLRLAAENGTSDIVATPHANQQYTFRPELIAEKIAELTAAVGNTIRVHHGCDFHLSFDNIQDSLNNPHKYAINNKKYLLVEFSDLLIPKSIDEVFFRMCEAGMIPIITHPERNALLQHRMNKLVEWVDAGCLVQVTALSFLGRFGKEAKACADRLLNNGLVQIVASDAHDTKHRPPVLAEAFHYVSKASSPRLAELLFLANPAATLTGDPIEMEDFEPAPAKKWYQFW